MTERLFQSSCFCFTLVLLTNLPKLSPHLVHHCNCCGSLSHTLLDQEQGSILKIMQAITPSQIERVKFIRQKHVQGSTTTIWHKVVTHCGSYGQIILKLSFPYLYHLKSCNYSTISATCNVFGSLINIKEVCKCKPHEVLGESKC